MFHTHHLTCMSHSLNKRLNNLHNNARIGGWVYFKIYFNWSLWKFFSMIRNNRLFSCDEVIVILVEGNKEMPAMLVQQDIPQGIELRFHSSVCFCLIKSICLLISWLKTIYLTNRQMILKIYESASKWVLVAGLGKALCTVPTTK